MKKLTKKEESEICLSCGECCKRYYITLLKEEIKPLAEELKISQKKFMQDYCEMEVKIFPKSTKGVLTLSTFFFPRRIGDFIKDNLWPVPQSFFVLPQIVLKRKQGICPFLNKDNSCKVYSVRPFPCKLFPFIAVEGYRENYPFCNLYKKTFKDYSKLSRNFFKRVNKYFFDIEEKGFSKYWRSPPKKGKIFLNETLIGKITLEELNEMFSQNW